MPVMSFNDRWHVFQHVRNQRRVRASIRVKKGQVGNHVCLWAGCMWGTSCVPITQSPQQQLHCASSRQRRVRLTALFALCRHLSTCYASPRTQMAACAYSPPRTRAALLCCFLLAALQASARPIAQPSAGRSLLQQPGTAAAGVATALRGAASATPIPQPTTQPLNSQVRFTPELFQDPLRCTLLSGLCILRGTALHLPAAGSLAYVHRQE